VRVPHSHQVRVGHGQTGARLALEQLDGGGMVFPLGAEQLDGTGRIAARFARGEDRRERTTPEARQEFVTWNPWQSLHESGRDGNREKETRRETVSYKDYRPGLSPEYRES